MKRTFKYTRILLALALMTTLIAACSSNNNGNKTGEPSPTTGAGNASESSESAEDAMKEPYALTMALPIFGAVPADMKLVEAEINKLTQEKLNTTVTILPLSIGSYDQQMNLMTSSGEKLDLMFTFGIGSKYATDAISGKLLPIDPLLEKHGQGIVEAIGAEYMESARVNGQIYGVPTMHSFASQPAVFMRKDLVEKHNIDVDAIHSLNDLDNVFKTIKDNEPGVVPIASGLSKTMDFYRSYDKLGDGNGVLPGFDNDLKLVNWYESDEYAQLLNKMHNWFKEGYVNKDAATTKTNTADLLKANKAFSYITMNKPEIRAQEERLIGQELVVANLDIDAYAVTTDVIVGLWGIAQQSESPERVMKFLELMYTDKDLVNLIIWGIEGKHYVNVSDNVIKYPEGVDISTVGYTMNALTTSNPFIAYTFEGQDPKLGQSVMEFNGAANKSKALGFSFNPSNVQNELTAITNVTNRYKSVLETGSVAPDSVLKEFITQLKAAGMDKVIEEKQKQLDAWAASK
ncbi:putative aldouronate transport system substrate-binding protein [Paenibacillus endophyticus]|uniref:Putative aldouronate transport system substrate-binding protein n=1 Tax=Paenibacillus endophyticus TaxID=1294268 RepID=A0A7W5G9Z5_9BACL|nr:ABC transporter substrate-binding protein [Paenibacillus endophyticus]MBB3151467.1 putative aldouronate transport system substrate-binding protein [Paenibacillus endophyticus]